MKFLRFLLVAVLVLGLAVVAVNFIMDRRGAPVGTEPTGNTENAGASESTGTTEPSQVLAMSDYRPLGSFSEGKLLVQRKSDAAVVCIDKQGKILFTLDRGYKPHSFVHSRFYNGMTVVATDEPEPRLHLLTAEGRILRPEDYGGTEFLFAPLSMPAQQERFFADGYVMVSDGERFGLLNSNLQWEVSMSAEYRQSVMAFAAGISAAGWDTELYYGGGYYLSKAGWFQIKTCQQGQIFELPQRPGHPSDYWTEMWGADTLMFLDDLCQEPVLGANLGGYVGPLMEAGGSIVLPVYEDGFAGVLAVMDDGNRFTVVNEEGNPCFGAVEVFGESYTYDPVSGVYCVAGFDGTGGFRIQLFDKNGMLRSHAVPVPADTENVTAVVEGGVIIVCFYASDDASCELFDLTLQPLYQ